MKSVPSSIPTSLSSSRAAHAATNIRHSRHAAVRLERLGSGLVVASRVPRGFNRKTKSRCVLHSRREGLLPLAPANAAA